MTQIITPQMVRDTLVFKGPLSLTELCNELKLKSSLESNIILGFLLYLQVMGAADYDLEKGAWFSNIVLE